MKGEFGDKQQQKRYPYLEIFFIQFEKHPYKIRGIV